MAKKESTPAIERTYNVPLRKEYRKAPNWKRTPKAVVALKEFLVRHMKSEDIRIGNDVNRLIWKHGIQNPPHHVKITAKKDDKGVVMVSLFGEPKKATTEQKKAKKETKKTVAAPKVAPAEKPAAAKEPKVAAQ